MKKWIAVNLNDFHNSSKAWQGGSDRSVYITVIGAKTLEKARLTAAIGNNDAWMVLPFDREANIVRTSDFAQDRKNLWG